MIESSYAEKCKPAERLELYCNHGTNAMRPWCGVRYTGGMGCEIITGQYASPVDAADAALDADDTLPLWVPQHIKETLVSCWQIRGMEMYRNDIPYEICPNEHVAEGWRMMYERDMQPVTMYGWPMAEGIAVAA